jgi:hypothetical protein
MCDKPADLSKVLEVLWPASRVSFYFDGRIAEVPVDGQLRSSISRLLDEQPEFVLGRRSPDEVELEVEFPGSIADAEEFLAISGFPARVFIGHYPSADDDAVYAVTALVPDPDGAVRSEPH